MARTRKAGAGRKRKDFARNERGEQIPNVWTRGKLFYVLNPAKTTSQGREHFASLDRAIARRDELAGCLPTIIEDHIVQGESGDAVTEKRRRINPEYPDRDAAIAATFKGTVISSAYEKLRSDGKAGSSLQTVLDAYIEWYLQDRGIARAALESKAKAYAEVGQPSKPGRKKPIRDWLYFAPQRIKQTIREAIKYFTEFVTFAGCGLEHLTADTFVNYKQHVRQQATEAEVDAPNRWVSHRYKTVQAVFRRAQKERPSWHWPANLRDWLDLLESRHLEKGEKIIITPAEFEALLAVADAQWTAIFKLAMNGALNNTDVAGIEWKNLDLDNQLMQFPRRKTGRLRQTPLTVGVVDALREWKKEAPKIDRVFSTSRGQSWINGGDALGRQFDLIRTKAGIRQQVSFRAIRKSAPTAVMASRINNAELAVEMLLGHCPDKTWMYYVDASPECLQDAIKAVAAKYGLD